MKAVEKIIAAQASWILAGDDVELAVTQTGGHMAPVGFRGRRGAVLRPYYVNPWADEGLSIDDPVLRPLRGDFFCMPFGANADAHRRERHVCHGEPATAAWTFVDRRRDGPVATMELSMDTSVRPGRVVKQLSVLDGSPAVYSSHILSGYSGRMPLGHHATLAAPDKEGALRVSTSRFTLGMTPTAPIDDPTIGHYQSFRVGRRFGSLRRVPLKWLDERWADVTSLPARPGFTDLLGVFKKPASKPAWTAAVNAEAGWLWFSFKDAAVLPATLMWISNRGRHSPPWNGRNRCVGLEDVCGYFAEGLAPSVRANELTREGFATAVTLSPKRPTTVRYIQGAIPVPGRFGRVEKVDFRPGEACFHSQSGKRAVANVAWEFLATGRLG